MICEHILAPIGTLQWFGYAMLTLVGSVAAVFTLYVVSMLTLTWVKIMAGIITYRPTWRIWFFLEPVVVVALLRFCDYIGLNAWWTCLIIALQIVGLVFWMQDAAEREEEARKLAKKQLKNQSPSS